MQVRKLHYMMLEFCYAANLIAAVHLYFVPQSAFLRKVMQGLGWYACHSASRAKQRTQQGKDAGSGVPVLPPRSAPHPIPLWAHGPSDEAGASRWEGCRHLGSVGDWRMSSCWCGCPQLDQSGSAVGWEGNAGALLGCSVACCCHAAAPMRAVGCVHAQPCLQPRSCMPACVACRWGENALAWQLLSLLLVLLPLLCSCPLHTWRGR